MRIGEFRLQIVRCEIWKKFSLLMERTNDFRGVLDIVQHL